MFSLSAPRRLCAPSSLRLALAVLSLMLGTLFSSFAAHAGTYIWTTTDAAGKVTAQSPTYSGGAATYYGSSHPYGFSNGTYNGSGPGTCGGLIKAIFTWKADSPPAYLSDNIANFDRRFRGWQSEWRYLRGRSG